MAWWKANIIDRVRRKRIEHEDEVAGGAAILLWVLAFSVMGGLIAPTFLGKLLGGFGAGAVGGVIGSSIGLAIGRLTQKYDR